MTYRFATCGDCRQVHELICQLEEKQLSYEVFSRIWNVQRSSPHYLCLVCEEDGHLLGMVNLRFEDPALYEQCIRDTNVLIDAFNARCPEAAFHGSYSIMKADLQRCLILQAVE